MNKAFEDEPKPKPSNQGGSGTSCLLYGCLFSFILLVVLGALGAFVSYRFVTGTLEQYTADAPADLPTVAFTEEELAEIEERVETFRETIEKGGTPADLVLTADEINGLIAKDDDLNGRVYVTIHDGQVSGELSIPMDFMPLGNGRYFNAAATFDVSLSDGVLIVTLAGAEVKGKKVPEQFIDAMSQENLAKEVYKNPEAAAMLRRFESLTIEDDKIILRPRVQPAEKEEVDAETDESLETEMLLDESSENSGTAIQLEAEDSAL